MVLPPYSAPHGGALPACPQGPLQPSGFRFLIEKNSVEGVQSGAHRPEISAKGEEPQCSPLGLQLRRTSCPQEHSGQLEPPLLEPGLACVLSTSQCLPNQGSR